MLAKEHIDDLLRRNGSVLSTDGDKIGSIGQVYADDDNGQPTWVTAKTGLFGTSESFVPLEGARTEGGDLVVPYTKDQVKDAPRVDTDGHLERAEEDRLYAHYGIGDGNRTYTDAAAGRDGDYRDADYADTGGGAVGRDTSGPTTDDAMTRSEEHQQVTVPVSHEEISLDREPIAEANRGNAYGGPAISEEEHEVTLHAERPVVDTEAVAVERVRLGTRPAASDDSDRCRICHPGRHLSSRTGSCTGWWAVLGRTEARPRAVNPPQSTARGRCGSTFRHAEILGGASHQSGGWGASQRVRCAVCPPPRSGRRRGPVAMQPARCQMSTSRRRAGVATIPDICSGALPLGRFAPALNRNPDVVSHRNTGRRSP